MSAGRRIVKLFRPMKIDGPGRSSSIRKTLMPNTARIGGITKIPTRIAAGRNMSSPNLASLRRSRRLESPAATARPRGDGGRHARRACLLITGRIAATTLGSPCRRRDARQRTVWRSWRGMIPLPLSSRWAGDEERRWPTRSGSASRAQARSSRRSTCRGSARFPAWRSSRSRTRRAESTRRAADALGIPRTYRHWGELIEDDEIDAILIGTWPYLHAPIAIEALYAGKHVLTEARMATDADAAAAMVEAAHRAAAISWRWWCRPRSRCGRIARSGACWATARIGRLLAVRVAWDAGTGTDRGRPLALAAAVQRQQRDVARHPRARRWRAGWARRVDHRRDRSCSTCASPAPGRGLVPTDVPDHLVAIAGFGGEVTATIEMSTVTLRGAGIHASVLRHGRHARGRLRGGTLAVRRAGAAATAAPEPVEIAPDERDEWRAERDFVAAIRGEAQVELTDFETGRRYMQFVDAVHESNREGTRVVLGD